MELCAHRVSGRRRERAVCLARRLRRERPGSPRTLACRLGLRRGLGADRGARGMGALQHRDVDVGSLFRLDVGRQRALGLGAVSLWTLGLRRRLLGVDTGASHPAGLRSRARRVLRRGTGRRGSRRGARHRLGRARLGGTRRSVVGGPRFVGAPWWGGWGGPRVVNNVVINRTTIINVQNITTYRNATAPNAVVAVEHQRFGQGLITRQHVARVDIHALEPVRGRLDVKPSPGSLVPSSVRGVRPPEQHLARPVVATRVPQPAALGPTPETVKPTPVTRAAPTPRLVPAPQEPNAAVAAPRPPFGRGQAERPQPSPPPIFKGGPPRTPQVVAPPPRPSGPPAARESNALETPGRTSPASVPAPRPSPRAASPTPEVATPRPAPAPPMSPVKPPVVGEPR